MSGSIACLRCLEHIAVCRGVCASCDCYQRKQIREGKTTDAKLVASGQRDAPLPKRRFYQGRVQ